jgi:hypothetical protein
MKEALEKAAALKPQLVLVFAGHALWQDKAAVAAACAPLKDAQVLGCSTAGELCSEPAFTGSNVPDKSPSRRAQISDDSVSVLAMRFENTQVKAVTAPVASAAASRGAGLSIAEDLKNVNLRAIVAFCPGGTADGSVFARAAASVLNPKVAIAGGLAAGDQAFKNAVTMLNGQVLPGAAVAFGLYGDAVQLRSGARSGWRPFGPARRVTKATGNVLFELDGRRALSLLEAYLGDRISELPRSGLSYPFVQLLEDDRRETGVIRMVIGIDREKGSLLLAGEVPQNALLRLMHADTELLVECAAAAAKESAPVAGAAGATMLLSCAGRRYALGDDAVLEAEAAARSLGNDAPYAGFYGCGVFGAVGASAAGQPAGARDLLNQTIMATHITETGKAAT